MIGHPPSSTLFPYTPLSRSPATGPPAPRRDATSAHRWPQIAELHVVERVGFHGRGRGRGDGSLFRPATTLRGRGQSERHRYEEAAETGLTESRAMHRDQLLRWVMISAYENSYPARQDGDR